MMANGCWRDRRPSKPRINSRHWKRNFSFPFEDRRYGSLMKFADRLPGEWDLFIGRCHFVESIIARMAIGWEKFRYLSLFEFNYSNLTYHAPISNYSIISSERNSILESFLLSSIIIIIFILILLNNIFFISFLLVEIKIKSRETRLFTNWEYHLFDKIVVERNLIYPSNTANKWREIGSRQEFIEMALVCITQRGLESGWKNKVAYRPRDKSFVNLQNDWIVCYAVM